MARVNHKMAYIRGGGGGKEEGRKDTEEGGDAERSRKERCVVVNS